MAISNVLFWKGLAKLEVHPTSGRGQRFDVVFGRVALKPNGAIKFDDKDWMKVPLILEVWTTAVSTRYPFGYF